MRAAIDEADYVTMKHLEHARDKVLMGPEGKLKLRDEEVNRITAFHEAGHALVAFYTKDATPLHKVTIVPRGPSLGHVCEINLSFNLTIIIKKSRLIEYFFKLFCFP